MNTERFIFIKGLYCNLEIWRSELIHTSSFSVRVYFFGRITHQMGVGGYI